MSTNAHRIGIVTYDFHPPIGGGGRHVTEVCRRLDPATYVVYSGQRNDLERHRSVLGGVPHGFAKQWLISTCLNLRLGAWIRTDGLTGINVHTGPGGLFLLRKPCVRVIATAHHTYAQQVEHMPAQRWKRALIPFERRTLRHADDVICVSEDTRAAVVERYGIAAERTHVIPNGIDTRAFAPDPAIEREPKSLLFLSRLDRRKGVDFLLRAMVRVVAADAAVKLRIGGKGALRPELERFVREHGLERNVEFLGFVPDAELPDLYRRAACFVMPSVFEGFGIPVLEAMACGTPVIGTDVDGVRTLIDHGVTGLLVDYGDEAAMAAAITRVCSGAFAPPADWSERVRQDYDWARIADAYARVFAG